MEATKEKRATHTPGPWVAMGKAVYTESDNPTREILWGGHNTRSASDEEKKANARLIAAAPELLAQCKFLERMLVTTGHHSSNRLAKVREILAKVEGRNG